MEPATLIPAWNGLEGLRPCLEQFLARRCRDDNELDDVVQETLMRAARYRASLADPTRLRAWVMRIALNVLRDHVRRENRFPRVERGDEVFETLEGREAAPDDPQDEVQLHVDGQVLERQLALRHLCWALAQLRSSDRAVLGSYYAGSGRGMETARVCDISPQLVKVHLFRARKRLLRAMRARLCAERDGALFGFTADPAHGAQCAPRVHYHATAPACAWETS